MDAHQLRSAFVCDTCLGELSWTGRYWACVAGMHGKLLGLAAMRARVLALAPEHQCGDADLEAGEVRRHLLAAYRAAIG